MTHGQLVQVVHLFAPGIAVLGTARFDDINQAFVLESDGTIYYAFRPQKDGKTFVFPVLEDGGISVIGNTRDPDTVMHIVDAESVAAIIKKDFFWVNPDGSRVEEDAPSLRAPRFLKSEDVLFAAATHECPDSIN